jgi:hypothetical protein
MKVREGSITNRSKGREEVWQIKVISKIYQMKADQESTVNESKRGKRDKMVQRKEKLGQ